MGYLKRIPTLVAIILMPLILSACFFPEKFESTVEVREDGTFNFSYDGILTFIVWRAEKIYKGKSPTDKDIKEFENEFKQKDGFKEVEYLGNAQFKVAYEKEGTINEPFYFLSKDVELFSIVPQDNGVIEVQGLKLKANTSDVAELEKLGLGSIDGSLTIKTDGEVIEHNASSSPSLFGLIGGYNWKIESITDSQPKIIIKIK